MGRRWNVDPISKAWESVYATFRNNPIFYNDPSGLQPEGGEDDKNKKPDDPPLWTKTLPEFVITPQEPDKKPGWWSRAWSSVVSWLRSVNNRFDNEPETSPGPPVKTDFHGDMPIGDGKNKNVHMTSPHAVSDPTGINPGEIIGGIDGQGGHDISDDIDDLGDIFGSGIKIVYQFALAVQYAVNQFSNDKTKLVIEKQTNVTIEKEVKMVNMKIHINFTDGDGKIIHSQWKEMDTLVSPVDTPKVKTTRTEKWPGSN